MRWPQEWFIQFDTHDTVDWLVLDWQAQALYFLLLRKTCARGTLVVGRSGMRGMAALVRMPQDIVERSIQALLDNGWLERTPDGYQIPGFQPVYPTPRPSVPAAQQGEDIDIPIRLLTPEEREQRYRAGLAKAKERLEAPMRVTLKSHVYFIQQGESGSVKIGYSKNPAQRLATLQTGHSEPLHMRAMAPGSMAQERALHDRFSHLRVSGEWFRPGEDLIAYMRLVADRRAL